jgi:hypothetical protein
MEPYPALKKQFNLKTRQDEIEVDYLHKLNDEEKEFLNKFNEEYVNASLDRKEFNNNIHNTKQGKQSCDKRNNERRKCSYTRSKASNGLKYIGDLKKEPGIKNYEDILIDKIDNKEDGDEF